LSGPDLIRALERSGYVVPEPWAAIRLTHPGPPQHHLTIPLHDALKVGTLAAILDDLGRTWKVDRIQVLRRLLD
jgi:hypothetical protein